ncbi:DASH complex subunit Spc19 [Plectosphaerella cucumerina]|uniref:DASH complex subunit SPC19 n=1 Tax=Plectosphaerella cucumerina TaxID=40658 RepID=A0A8K0TRS4_9PEZI|nr:DASH complex subunit Spc19 [Plectosphaerella cucumerina]
MAGPSSYDDCVASLSHSLSFLTSSVQTLERATTDLPRLSTTLRTTRHFELIPQPSLAAAEASLRDEIGPYISLVLDRAETQVERQERRIETLKARSELLAGRMAAGDIDSVRGGGRPASSSRGDRGQVRTDGEHGLRVRALRTRKEGLKYSVERLELELEQKEKELRRRLGKS